MSSEMPVIPTPTPTPEKKMSTLALVSTITGALTYLLPIIFNLADKSALWATFLSPITAIVAIVTGHKGKSEIRNSQGAITGKKLANAGLIMGYIYWGLIVLGIILVIALGAAFYGVIKSTLGI
jgi:hypothetical protein